MATADPLPFLARQHPPQPLELDSQDDDICFHHPGYRTSGLLLTLPRVDSTVAADGTPAYGVHHRTALLACQIIAGNAFNNSRFAVDREGRQPVQVPLDGVLTDSQYYFIIDGSEGVLSAFKVTLVSRVTYLCAHHLPRPLNERHNQRRMMPFICPFPLWNNGRVSDCVQNNYLSKLIPLATCLVSLALLATRFYSLLVHNARSVDGFDPVAAEEEEEEEEEEGNAFRGATTSPQFEATSTIPPRIAVLEIIVVLADTILSLSLIISGRTAYDHPSPLAMVIFSAYLLLLLVARNSVAARSLGQDGRFQLHSSFLYVSAVALRAPFYTRLALFTILCLFHLTARRFRAQPRFGARTFISPPGKDEIASIISYLTYSWIDGLVWKAFRGTLQASDLYPLNRDQKSVVVIPGFYAAVSTTLPLLWRIYHFFKYEVLRQGAWAAVVSFTVFVPAILIRLILAELESPGTMTRSTTWLCISGLLVSGLFTGIADCQCEWIGRQISAKLRTVLISEIYAKVLRKRMAKPPHAPSQDESNGNNPAGDCASDGNILNLMSVDAEFISEISANVHLVWVSFPVQTMIATWLLYRLLGPSGVVGVLLMIGLLPLNILLSKKLAAVQGQVLTASDSRVQSSKDLINNIRTIKYLAWEASFIKGVLEKRHTELQQMRSRFIWWSISMTLFYSLPFIVTIFTCFFFTVVWGNDLGTSTAFPALALFAILRIPLNRMADSISFLLRAHVSVLRVDEFLQERETDKYSQLATTNISSVGFDNATLAWPTSRTPTSAGLEGIHMTDLPSSHPFQLQGLKIKFQESALNVVCGPSGSGKSSLLLALLGEMELISGQIHLPHDPLGEVAFGRSSLHNGWDSLTITTAYCPQEPWLLNQSIRANILFGLPYNGHRYSSVLHAVALREDLAALDNGDDTMAGENGNRLSGGQKQRVALARALYSIAKYVLLDDCLSAVDSRTANHIFFHAIKGPLMHNRTCILATHHTQLAIPNCDFAVILESGRVKSKGSAQYLISAGFFATDILERKVETLSKSSSSSESNDLQPKSGVLREFVSSRTSLDTEILDDDDCHQEFSTPHYSESKSEGAVAWPVFRSYLVAMGSHLYWITLIFVFTGQQLISLTTNLWIKEWAHEYDRRKEDSTEAATQNAMKEMEKVNSFFDQVPLGQITNRLSSDVGVMDQSLATFSISAFQILSSIAMVLALISIILPAFLFVAVIICLVYYMVMAVYINSSRDLKRIEAIERSPLYQQLGESLAGCVSIRAYARASWFTAQNRAFVDRLNQPYILLWASKEWLTFRIGFLSSVISFLVGAFIVWNQGLISPGAAGLALIYSVTFTENVLWFVQIFAIVQQNLNSVDRILEYTEIEQEPMEPLKRDIHVPGEWPAKGQVVFNNYSTRYAPDLDLVVKDISFEIEAGKRLAIVGRMGAGKSTLTLALIRGLEADSGQITIDGVDIAAVTLERLRQVVTVVPQDPTLFDGSLRDNLDPQNRHSDAEILSRQLLCISRALLRRSRLLVLDEATASVDHAVDALIQAGLRASVAAGTTVLTIAHRLITIADYDHIVVLEKGLVVEQGSVNQLLGRLGEDAIFRRLCKESGDIEAIKKAAEKSLSHL
ncbi:hypothetical protein G7Y89_g10861 [Cudoniella acicularis]|uniref:Uncharacterized protein n=1 Tax=Cudoniella acicularis TaxID=354080 RepID=A0A8H4RD08_9HELO|nr:hypothetical protein G7Y89_g10861 [Cudoniella acicularis]